MPVLTGIDVLGIQRFIFASNRLRDVVTGSFLVHWSTSYQGALFGLVAENNILLAGGGNAIVEFNTIDEAKVFAAQYTRLLYDEVPGLDVVLVHEQFKNRTLAVALQNLQIKLAKAKTERVPSVPLSGLSVTASCMETGLPATSVDRDEKTVTISRNIYNRRNKKGEANRYWEKYLEDKDFYDFPLELDKLGRDKGDTSLIGIVHVDGNGVGKKIKKWLTEKIYNTADDDTVRLEYKEWSQAIDQLGQEALQAVMGRIFQRLEISSDGQKVKVSGTPGRLCFELEDEKGKRMLPIRPILLGGDDLTFVCDGRIALDLAETAISVFEHSDIPHFGNITASAGVAIVRVHAPFARGYELAEKLCGSAKGKLKEENDSGCALDWHIGIARPGESVSGIRERQYHATNSNLLTCRPYRLGIGKDDNKETWRWLSRMLLDDNNCGLRGGVWSERRNKVKAFAKLIREDPNEVGSALAAWRVVDDKLQLPHPIAIDGFISNRTPLLDAVEIMDLHLVLDDADMTKIVEEKLP